MRTTSWTNEVAKNDWKKFIVPEAEPLTAPRRRRSLRSYGPLELGLRETVVTEGGPEAFVKNNPGLFATSSTSRHEGYAYWALLHIIGDEGVPGKNGLVWEYQSKVTASETRVSVVDFIIQGAMKLDLGIRIVTPFFHTEAGAETRAFDEEQRWRLLDQDIFVVDVFSLNYINDPTGQAAIVTMNRAIAAEQDYSPYHRSFGV